MQRGKRSKVELRRVVGEKVGSPFHPHMFNRCGTIPWRSTLVLFPKTYGDGQLSLQPCFDLTAVYKSVAEIRILGCFEGYRYSDDIAAMSAGPRPSRMMTDSILDSIGTFDVELPYTRVHGPWITPRLFLANLAAISVISDIVVIFHQLKPLKLVRMSVEK